MNVRYRNISFGKGMKMKEGAFLSHKGKMPLDGVDSWCIFAPLESYFSKIRVAFTLEQLCWILCIGQTCLNIQWPPKFAYLLFSNSIFIAVTYKMTSLSIITYIFLLEFRSNSAEFPPISLSPYCIGS